MNKFIQFFMVGFSGVLALLVSLRPINLGIDSQGIFEKTPFDPKHKITVDVQAFTGSESKQFLAANLIKRNIAPIRISLQNNTANQYSLCASSVDLPHVDPKKVASKVSKAVLPRLIAWRIAGFFFWPLLIPGTIDSSIAYAQHRALKKDYNAKSLKEKGEILEPYATFHRILFVPKNEVKEQFEITLIDIETLAPTTLEAQISPEN